MENGNDLISRQAAIDEIGEWIKAFLENGHKESAADARLIQDGIIQLPSTQPVDKDINVPTNDYISRQAAIDAVYKCADIFAGDMPVMVVKADAYEALAQLPSAQPERKRGKWNFIGDNMFECTSCGVVYTTRQLNGLRNYDTDPYAPKFCPNCGADMRGEQNEKCR